MGADGSIVFADGVGLFKVSSDGGAAHALARPAAARGETVARGGGSRILGVARHSQVRLPTYSDYAICTHWDRGLRFQIHASVRGYSLHEGDLPAEPRVAEAVDLAHAAWPHAREPTRAGGRRLSRPDTGTSMPSLTATRSFVLGAGRAIERMLFVARRHGISQERDGYDRRRVIVEPAHGDIAALVLAAPGSVKVPVPSSRDVAERDAAIAAVAMRRGCCRCTGPETAFLLEMKDRKPTGNCSWDQPA